MIQRIILIVVYCLALSLSVHADVIHLACPQEYISSDKQIVSDSIAIMKFIAHLSHDENLIMKLDAMNLVPNCDVVQKYSCVCTLVDWSLKDFKKIELIADHFKIKFFFDELVGFQDLITSRLLSMQRDNRHRIKNMILVMQDIPNSDYLQISLQQLFHALHEVKKEIATLDNVSSIRAWYIYTTLLFLHVMLMQGMNYIESTMHEKVDQQIIMYQLLYLSERFKHSMLSDFTIAKGGLS